MNEFVTDGCAIVTGAGSGIGKGTAFAFARNGASGIVFADLDFGAAKNAAEESKTVAVATFYNAVPVQVDVADIESVNNMVNQAKAELVRISYCVNSAGIATPGPKPIADLPRETFDHVQSINVGGTFNVSQAALGLMRNQEIRSVAGPSGSRVIGRGVIVNISSAMGVFAMPTAGAYVASKHAIQGLTKTIALENGPHAIRACSVLPGWVNTPLMENNLHRNPSLRETIKKACPLGRMATVEEVANAILFLCSPAGSFMNGTALIVDGGLTTTTCTP